MIKIVFTDSAHVHAAQLIGAFGQKRVLRLGGSGPCSGLFARKLA